MNVLKQMASVSAVMVVAGLAGCFGNGPILATPTSGTTGGSNSGLAGGGAGTVYVVQLATTGAQTILTFPAGGIGALTPTGTLAMPALFQLSSVAVDAGGQIYAGGVAALQQEVLVFAAGATGTATPVRTILVGNPLISTPIEALTTDAAGSLYVSSSNGSVWQFGPTASGAATPTRTIAGALTGLSNGTMYGTAVDAAGDVYVSTASGPTQGAILEFGPTATGNVAPIRTITGTVPFFGIAVDVSGNIFAAEDSTTGTLPAVIAEFTVAATGAAVPVKTITLSGSATSVIGGLRVDAVGNLFAVEALISSTQNATYTVVATGPGTTGNVAPAASMSSTAWAQAGSQLAIR